MTAVSVTFKDAWLTDVTNPTVSITASFPTRALSAALTGRMGIYAGGRRRVITTPADAVTRPLTLQWLNDADLAQLVLWRGRVLLLRDSAGLRVFGMFLQVDATDIFQTAGTRHMAVLVFTELDYSEAV